MDKVKNTLTVSPCRRIPPPRNKMSHLFAISMFTFWLLWRPDLCLPFFDLCVDQTYMYLFLASCKNLTYVYLFFLLLCKLDLCLPFFDSYADQTYIYLFFFASCENQTYVYLFLTLVQTGPISTVFQLSWRPGICLSLTPVQTGPISSYLLPIKKNLNNWKRQICKFIYNTFYKDLC